MEDETQHPPTRPHLPSHKQTRINIWRSEVASLTPRPRPPCSSAQSTTTTTSSSSSGASSAILATAPAEDGALRRRSLWRRLANRIRGKGDEEHESGAVANGLHTEMYKEELGTWQTPASPAVDAVSSEGGRGLKDKKERLERAARLLNEGADKP